MSNSILSEIIKEAVRNARTMEDLRAINFDIPNLPPIPPLGRYSADSNQMTAVYMTSIQTEHWESSRGRSNGYNTNSEIGTRNVFGGFEVRSVNETQTSPILTRYADGYIRVQGEVVRIGEWIFLYEDSPLYGAPGSGFKIAGRFRQLSLLTYDPGTIWEDRQVTTTITWYSASFTPPRQPDTPPPDDNDDDDDDDDDDEEPPPPPCDIPITSNFDFGYFCLTKQEYDTLMRDIRNIEQNLEQYRW